MDSTPDLQNQEAREEAARIQAGRVDAITWLRLTRKSTGQIAVFLHQRGYREGTIQEVLLSLSADGTIDDVALARAVVRSRQGRQAESRQALRQRMLRQGLSEQAVDAALPDEALDESAARDLVAARYGKQIADAGAVSVQAGEHPARRQLRIKIGRFLLSRGFSTQIALRVLSDFFPDIDSDGASQA